MNFPNIAMEVISFTDSLADLRIRYQITYMRESVLIWTQIVPAEASDKVGSMPQLSLAMPSIKGGDYLPPATNIIGGGANDTSRNVAQKLAKRFGIAVYASIDHGGDPGLEVEVILKRLTRELQNKGLGSSNDGAADAQGRA